jgi:predicted transcriptional regulator
MSLRFILSVLLLSLSVLPLAAQNRPAPAAESRAGLDEADRLMQEYMVRRAELIELRQRSLDQVKAAKDDKERKQHRDKLAADEKPVLARVAEAARAYQAAEKAKRDKLAESKPRG